MFYEIKHKKEIIRVKGYPIIFSEHIFLNYFNRILITDDSVVLFCERTNNIDQIMYKEFKILINKLLKLLGQDSDKLGEYMININNEISTPNRKWVFDDCLVFFYANYNDDIKSCCLELILRN